MLGHEVSHLELGRTRVEITTTRRHLAPPRPGLARRDLPPDARLHRSSRVGKAPPFGGFVPVFDRTLYVSSVPRSPFSRCPP